MASATSSLFSSSTVSLRSRSKQSFSARRPARVIVRAEAINPSIRKDVEKVVDFIKVEEIKGKVKLCHYSVTQIIPRDLFALRSTCRILKLVVLIGLFFMG